jgi:hypothetical protein
VVQVLQDLLVLPCKLLVPEQQQQQPAASRQRNKIKSFDDLFSAAFVKPVGRVHFHPCRTMLCGGTLRQYLLYSAHHAQRMPPNVCTPKLLLCPAAQNCCS